VIDPRLQKLMLYGTPGYRIEPHGWKEVVLRIYKFLKHNKITILEESCLFKEVQKQLRSEDYRNAGVLKEVFLAALGYDLEPSMKNIRKPTLILHGETDTVVPLWVAEKMRTTIPGASLQIVPETTHYIHLENPGLFAGIIRNFLTN
jgi:pimeloyl-ACP methyl ester carboxylesterase